MADSWDRFLVNVTQVRRIYDDILDVRRLCASLAQTTGDRAWYVVAQDVIKIQDGFAQDLREIARVSALDATKEIKADLKAKIVRPPTGNRPGLQDLIFSTPVPAHPFEFGEVEVAWLSRLDQAVNPDGGTKPYWRAQEFGSSHLVGKTIFGVFIGAAGVSVPNQLEFRVHPLFSPMGAMYGGGPGKVMRAIQPKRFLEHGTAVAEARYFAMVRVAMDAAIAQLNAIQLPSAILNVMGTPGRRP